MKAVRTSLPALAAVLALALPGPAAHAGVEDPPGAATTATPDCVMLAPYDYECVFMSVVKARVVIDQAARRLTTRAYLGHDLFGWRMVAERTWPSAREGNGERDGERDDLCGTAFGHTACVHAEFSWAERFVSLRGTYDGREVGSWRYEW